MGYKGCEHSKLDPKSATDAKGSTELERCAYMPDKWEVLQVQQSKHHGQNLPNAEACNETERVEKCQCCHNAYT